MHYIFNSFTLMATGARQILNSDICVLIRVVPSVATEYTRSKRGCNDYMSNLRPVRWNTNFISVNENDYFTQRIRFFFKKKITELATGRQCQSNQVILCI